MARFGRVQLTSYAAKLALVVLAFSVVITSSFIQLRAASKGIAETSVLRGALHASAVLLKLQLDEETGLRGYALAWHRVFLEPYLQGQERFPAALATLQGALGKLGTAAQREEAQQLRLLHDSWVAEVAQPTLRGSNTIARQARGKVLVDRFRSISASLDHSVDAAANSRRDSAQADLNLGVALFGSAILLVIVAALIVVSAQRRLRQDLERERGIVASLQRAFVSGKEVVPEIDVGVAYRSATEGTFVGGDVFDVHLLQDGRVLLMVADVSGKGVDAAVETALIKYTVRALARTIGSPAEIARQVNQVYGQDRARWGSGSFVVLFVAILDLTTGEVRYASAGHGSAYLRRGAAVQTLAVTGPALGIFDDTPYGEERLALLATDTLLVVTDGLTESRNRRGELLTEHGVAEWFAQSPPSVNAQALVDGILGRAFERSNGKIADDLAVVCARIVTLDVRANVLTATTTLPSAQ